MLIYLQMLESPEEKSILEQIYLEYRGLMYHVAYEILHNEQDAEDAVHHAFVKIAENIKKITDPVCPKTHSYVVTIVEHQAIDQYITEPTPPQESALKGNKRMSWRTWFGGSLFGISALIIFVLWRLSVRFPISGMTGNGVHLTGFSGFLGFHGILHESYVIVAIGIIGLILVITDFIRIKKNNR